MGVPLKSIAKRWMKEPGFKKGYDALEEEFSLASQLIEARSRAGLTQAEVAVRMGTSQSTVARLESGAAKGRRCRRRWSPHGWARPRRSSASSPRVTSARPPSYRHGRRGASCE